MTELEAYQVLETFPKRSKIAKWYDDPDHGDKLQEAIFVLMPDFEYPSFSYMTIGAFMKRIMNKAKFDYLKSWPNI
ncbi:hypothetical protein LCGC14_3133530 [marine sediment metagenome]|uniref:Uncharacterized protein n=1 Tax=marine sediment metagenome TaxID=412755 RepID=A0A0F8WMW0_9ZZZZ